MPRGRQYYDPIQQVPATVEGAPDLSRIELFPVGQDSTSRLPEQIGKWIARRVVADGSVVAESQGSFDHDAALAEAQALWPGETVYELRSEIEDSTWEGTGPSPRLWQRAIENRQEIGDAGRAITFLPEAETNVMPPASQPTEEQAQLRVLPIDEPGVYVRLEDIRGLLEMWAVAYEVDKNPSAALALREAVDALKEIG